jgi:hypothetical protein
MKRMPRPGEEINFNILSSFYYRWSGATLLKNRVL